MSEVIQVRLGRKRTAEWKRFLKRTGLKQGDALRAAVDAQLKKKGTGLPPVVSRWAGRVNGRGVTATNSAVAREMGR